MTRISVEVSWASLLRILLFLVLVVVMFYGKDILLGLFLAIVISSGLEVIVDFLEKRGFPRTLGVILLFLAILLFFIIVVYTVIPFVIASLNTLFSNLSRSDTAAWWSPLVGFQTSQTITALINKISSRFLAGGPSALGTLSQTLGSVGLAVAVVVSSFYLSLSKDGVERFIRAVLPTDYEDSALRIYERSKRKIGSWFRVQVVLSLVMGILVWGTLYLLGVRHSFILGILAAVLEIVPFVGPILAGGAAMLVAVTDSYALAVYTLIAFLVLHQLESHVLVPVFTNRVTNLHPVIVIISLLIGFQAGGLLGLVIAVPAAAILQEVVEEWSGRKKSAAKIG
ncbi:AI-2E family transporter [Candidatus Parcubacteria bacterium]|nr:MAG: AI-2E family transporter [Candidatus Parcubacteria bacterium]